MTNATVEYVSGASKVDVYPDEFKPIMKALKYATICDEADQLLTPNEKRCIDAFLDYFKDIALENAI